MRLKLDKFHGREPRHQDSYPASGILVAIGGGGELGEVGLVRVRLRVYEREEHGLGAVNFLQRDHIFALHELGENGLLAPSAPVVVAHESAGIPCDE